MGFFSKSKNKQKQKAHQDNTIITNDITNKFTSVITFDIPNIDINFLAKQLKDNYGIELPDNVVISDDKKTLVFEYLETLMAFTAINEPLPMDDLITCAKTNDEWPEAVSVAKNHKSHITVQVIGRNTSPVYTGILSVQMCSCCLKHRNATAINTLGSLFLPKHYIELADIYLMENSFPFANLILINTYISNAEKSLHSGYTCGMENFGKKDIEIVYSSESTNDIYDILESLSNYIITHDVTLKNGGTVGFTDDQQLTVTYSHSDFLNKETMKVNF